MVKYLKKKINNKIITLLQIIFIMGIIISSIKIIKWYIQNKENEQLTKKMSETITINETEGKDEKTSKYNVDFESLKKENEDTVAWVKVLGTNVEYTVVQTNDNNYYLKHNFAKKYNEAGWVFADYRNKMDGTDKNIVVYGHNRRNESMFGTLKNILNPAWYEIEENRKVIFITETENCIYETFSIYQVEKEDYYINTEFNDVEFLNYIETIKNRSIKDFGIEIKEDDTILTLSTCADNSKYRVVLHAKKIK